MTLSDDKIDEYVDAFSTFDTDSCGSVSASNLHALLLFLGYENTTIEDAVQILAVKEIPVDGGWYMYLNTCYFSHFCC